MGILPRPLRLIHPAHIDLLERTLQLHPSSWTEHRFTGPNHVPAPGVHKMAIVFTFFFFFFFYFFLKKLILWLSLNSFFFFPKTKIKIFPLLRYFFIQLTMIKLISLERMKIKENYLSILYICFESWSLHSSNM
jgi:hypothetical protein